MHHIFIYVRRIVVGYSDMNKGKISVIIPCFNCIKYLKECVNSIINQTYSNYEIILIDDGSFDGTSQLCDELADSYGFIRTFHKGNGGAASARNVGLNVAIGEYVSFIDGDDYIDSGMFEELISYFDDDVIAVSCGTCRHEGNTVRLQNCPKRIEKFNTINSKIRDYSRSWDGTIGNSCCSKLFKRNLLGALRYVEDIVGEDVIFLLSVCETPYKIISLNKPFYHYIQRNNSVTNSNVDYRTINFLKILNNAVLQFKGCSYINIIRAKKLSLQWNLIILNHIFNLKDASITQDDRNWIISSSEKIFNDIKGILIFIDPLFYLEVINNKYLD